MTKRENFNTTKTASWLAGTAMIGNALFGRSKETMSWTIITVYLLFGGIFGFFNYLGNVFRWLSYERVGVFSRILHVILPPLTLLSGFLGWYAPVYLGVTNGWVALSIAAACQIAFSSWCFYVLGRVNLKEGKLDQVSYASAAYMYIGFLNLLLVIWAFAVLGNR